MLQNIPNDLLIIIFSKLPNYDIINLLQVCKDTKYIIKTDFFVSYLLRRKHPIVFNSEDRYCNICNLHIYRINDKNKCFLKCSH